MIISRATSYGGRSPFASRGFGSVYYFVMTQDIMKIDLMIHEYSRLHKATIGATLESAVPAGKEKGGEALDA